jgi:hypothetical protein
MHGCESTAYLVVIKRTNVRSLIKGVITMDHPTEHIISQYQHSDSERRVYMFLSYPSLRNDFSKISSHGDAPRKYRGTERLRKWVDGLSGLLFF